MRCYTVHTHSHTHTFSVLALYVTCNRINHHKNESNEIRTDLKSVLKSLGIPQVKTNEVKQKLMFRDSTLLSNELNETDTKIINAMSLEAATVAGARCKLRCYEADEMSIFA